VLASVSPRNIGLAAADVLPRAVATHGRDRAAALAAASVRAALADLERQASPLIILPSRFLPGLPAALSGKIPSVEGFKGIILRPLKFKASGVAYQLLVPYFWCHQAGSVDGRCVKASHEYARLACLRLGPAAVERACSASYSSSPSRAVNGIITS